MFPGFVWMVWGKFWELAVRRINDRSEMLNCNRMNKILQNHCSSNGLENHLYRGRLPQEVSAHWPHVTLSCPKRPLLYSDNDCSSDVALYIVRPSYIWNRAKVTFSSPTPIELSFYAFCARPTIYSNLLHPAFVCGKVRCDWYSAVCVLHHHWTHRTSHMRHIVLCLLLLPLQMHHWTFI